MLSKDLSQNTDHILPTSTSNGMGYIQHPRKILEIHIYILFIIDHIDQSQNGSS